METKWTLLKGCTHLFGYKDKDKEFSKWTYDMQRYSLSQILELFKEYNITRVVDLGDELDSAENLNWELNLLDYFWSNIPNEVEKVKVSGNHELVKSSIDRTYITDTLADFYKEKWGVKVYQYEEVKVGNETDLYCSHKYINKLQNLKKKYRYIYSHIRLSDGNAYYSDEINITVPKACAKKILLSDIHQHLEFDNIVYSGASSWVHFPKSEQEEKKIKSTPSVVLLNEETGEHKRIELFNENSPYQKKLRILKWDEMFDDEQLENIIEEMRQDSKDNKSFYKVRVYAKKFLLDKIKRVLREKDTKGFIKAEYINISMNDYKVEQIQFSKIVKQCLDNDSVSKSLLEYIKKTNDDPNLEDLIVSTYATLEGFVGEGK